MWFADQVLHERTSTETESKWLETIIAVWAIFRSVESNDNLGLCFMCLLLLIFLDINFIFYRIIYLSKISYHDSLHNANLIRLYSDYVPQLFMHICMLTSKANVSRGNHDEMYHIMIPWKKFSTTRCLFLKLSAEQGRWCWGLKWVLNQRAWESGQYLITQTTILVETLHLGTHAYHRRTGYWGENIILYHLKLEILIPSI